MSIEITSPDHRDADQPAPTEACKRDDTPLTCPRLVEQRLDDPLLGDAEPRDDTPVDDASSEDSRLYAPRPGLRPFRQGELDALCGLYAILNAARWAAWPTLIEREMMETLFARLSTYAVNALPLPSLCSSGITVPQLRKLLHHAMAFLDNECGLRFKLETIPAKTLLISHDPHSTLRIPVSARIGEAFILNITHNIRHWSVFEALEGRRLRLFDSTGWRRLPLRRVAFHSAFRLMRVDHERSTTPLPRTHPANQEGPSLAPIQAAPQTPDLRADGKEQGHDDWDNQGQDHQERDSENNRDRDSNNHNHPGIHNNLNHGEHA